MNTQLPAIPAATNLLGNELIYRFLIRLPLWNAFDRVWVQIVGRLPRSNEGPLICYMNHPSWWDGYMVAIVHRLLLRWKTNHYVMMEEQQLQHYRFFTWAGAFSVDRQNPRKAVRSIAYISNLLGKNPNHALYIFPQGEITPNDRRPLVLFPGVAHVAKRVGRVVMAPVGLRYEFRGEQRPELFIRFGPMHHVQEPVQVRDLMDEIAQRLTDSVNILRDQIIADDVSHFRVLLHGRSSVNRIFDRVKVW